MCYLVTGVSPSVSSASSRARIYEIFDTEEEAKERAAGFVVNDCNEVAVWKQIATPSIEKKVVWEEKE